MTIGTTRELSHAARDWLRNVRKAGRERFMIDRAIAAVTRLPVVISLGAVRHAPRSSRTKILRGAIRSPSAPAPAGAAEVCEINSLADFDSRYARLAAMLGHAGRDPSPGELEFLNSIAKRWTSYPGNIGLRLTCEAEVGSSSTIFNGARWVAKQWKRVRRCVGAPLYGAEWLFDRWPFRKISGGNIGAIQLPDDKRTLIPFALRLMSRPFESTGRAARVARRAIYQSFAELI